MAKQIIPEKLIIQSILSKSHKNPDFLAQLAYLPKFVVILVIMEGVSGVRMHIRCNLVAIFVSAVLYARDHDIVSRGESVHDRRHRPMSHAPHNDSYGPQLYQRCQPLNNFSFRNETSDTTSNVDQTQVQLQDFWVEKTKKKKRSLHAQSTKIGTACPILSTELIMK